MRPIAVLTILIISLSGLAYTAWQAWAQAEAYQQTTLTIIDQLKAKDRLQSSTKLILEKLSLGLYEGYSEQMAELQQLKQRQAQQRRSVEMLTLYFLLLIPAALLAAFLLRRQPGDLAYAMLLISVIALLVGLSAPILSIGLTAEIPVLGKTVLQFESKGILSTVLTLQQSGNHWLAVLLFVFSILIPMLKTLVTGLTFFARTHHWSLRGLALVRHIGKWSMADVFVVAILIAFFAHHGKSLTDTEVQVGLYFFAIYVVMSILATQIIDRVLQRRESSS